MVVTISTDTTIEAELREWELKITQQEWSAHVKNDSHKPYQFGAKSWEATAIFYVDDDLVTADHELKGKDTTAIRFNYDGTKGWVGTTSRIRNIQPTSPMNNPLEFVLSFRGTAAIAFVDS